MKVLVACEFSGIVRDAFTLAGHDAMSCDLLPTEAPGKHYQGSVMDVLHDGWDLMIAHPPCTYISYAATAYWNTPGRAQKRLEALSFFLQLLEAPIARICIENPVGCADGVLRKHDQIIHPYYFGDPDMKRTCLWLKGLPTLTHKKTADLFGGGTACIKPQPTYVDKGGKKRYRTDAISGFSTNAKKERARFFPGIATAMAQQWGAINNYESQI